MMSHSRTLRYSSMITTLIIFNLVYLLGLGSMEGTSAKHGATTGGGRMPVLCSCMHIPTTRPVLYSKVQTKIIQTLKNGNRVRYSVCVGTGVKTIIKWSRHRGESFTNNFQQQSLKHKHELIMSSENERSNYYAFFTDRCAWNACDSDIRGVCSWPSPSMNQTTDPKPGGSK
jgi:hypothetical protein